MSKTTITIPGYEPGYVLESLKRMTALPAAVIENCERQSELLKKLTPESEKGPSDSCA